LWDDRKGPFCTACPVPEDKKESSSSSSSSS